MWCVSLCLHGLWFDIPCEASACSREADSDQVRYQFNGLHRASSATVEISRMADRRDWGGGGDDPEENTQRMIERIWESLTDIRARMDQQEPVPPVAVPPGDGEAVPVAPVPPRVEVPFVAPVPPPVLLVEEPVMQVEKFLRLQPLTYSGGLNPDTTEHWVHEIERVFATMRCPAADKVVLATYQLRGFALEWWRLKMQTTFAGRTEEASARSREADSDQVRYRFNGLGRASSATAPTSEPLEGVGGKCGGCFLPPKPIMTHQGPSTPALLTWPPRTVPRLHKDHLKGPHRAITPSEAPPSSLAACFRTEGINFAALDNYRCYRTACSTPMWVTCSATSSRDFRPAHRVLTAVITAPGHAIRLQEAR
ncbi:hypothetical protein Taro_031926 [Colocasia esculenta]|uniref:Retrotransposon gag domain-containing protein n=1 Tax=Colocasia esculenta TaxID=4460 RepID=A0A843VRB0_COLES|nr:hypothetical protein [Colocasia esculenta]